jgi:hypothetical protein
MTGGLNRIAEKKYSEKGWFLGTKRVNASTRFANESSDRSASKPVSGIKVPSNVVSDTALRGFAAKLHTGDVLRGCNIVARHCVMRARPVSAAMRFRLASMRHPEGGTTAQVYAVAKNNA